MRAAVSAAAGRPAYEVRALRGWRGIERGIMADARPAVEGG